MSYTYQVSGKENRPSNYKEIQALDLSGKSLTSLPLWIRDCTALKDLNISNNQLKELPLWVTNLKALEVLNISNNDFVKNNMRSSYPDLSKLPHLQTVTADNVGMGEFPECLFKMKNLTKLSLKNNNFNTIPYWMEEMMKTKTVNLEGCKKLEDSLW